MPLAAPRSSKSDVMSRVPSFSPGPIYGEFSHTIGGAGFSGSHRFGVIDPATAQVFAQCPEATRDQLDAAVAAARKAFSTWGSMPVEERRAYVNALAQLLRSEVGTLAPLLTQEQGKPLKEAEREILSSADHIDALCKVDIGPELLRSGERDHVQLQYYPLGVIGAITPWNFPVALAIWKVGHALYTGNTVVLKPSPYTPLTTLRIAELTRGVLPAGVLNVLAGGGDCGAWMCEHPDIDKISFTGSVPTGKRVLATASTSLKRVTLELGGNDAAIVLPDADVAEIAHGLFWGAFRNSGQVCKAIKRIYIHETLYEPLGEALADIARSTRVGNGFDPSVQLGPVQNRPQFDIVKGLIDDALANGGRLLSGNEPVSDEGYFIAPTLVADMAKGHRLVEEEPFGPAVPLISYRSIDDAIRQANDSRFGLSGSVWTSDPDWGRTIASRLEVGTAWVNQHGAADPELPFGGAKESGVGRENSILGLRDYMQLRVVQSPPVSGQRSTHTIRSVPEPASNLKA